MDVLLPILLALLAGGIVAWIERLLNGGRKDGDDETQP